MTRLESEIREGFARRELSTDKPVLICMVGLPRSGKSTWARMMGVPMVCPDHIRLAMHGRPFLEEAEPWVWVMVKTMLKALFYSGHYVVILDAVNGTSKRRSDWINQQWNLVFKVIHTPKAECLERAVKTARPDLVPVIEKMAQNWQAIDPSEGRRLSDFTNL